MTLMFLMLYCLSISRRIWSMVLQKCKTCQGGPTLLSSDNLVALAALFTEYWFGSNIAAFMHTVYNLSWDVYPGLPGEMRSERLTTCSKEKRLKCVPHPTIAVTSATARTLKATLSKNPQSCNHITPQKAALTAQLEITSPRIHDSQSIVLRNSTACPYLYHHTYSGVHKRRCST